MIGKISLGKSFKGCIAYCLEDKKLKQSGEITIEHRAEPILYNRCFGEKKDLIDQFNDQRSLNRKLEKPVMHITLSLAPGEKLEREKLIELIQDCAKNLGFENNQYLAVSHMDTNHQHVHLVVNRINRDGKTLSDSNNYKKIAGFCRQMEQKYNLKQVLSPRPFLPKEQRLIPRHDQRKEKLRDNVKQSLYTSKNYQEFQIKMKEKGYQVIKGRGISFLDGKGVKCKGSQVGFSLMRIEKIFEKKLQLQQLQDSKLQRGPILNPHCRSGSFNC
jgi:Relaxase/Mobilisation nuclease domain